MKNWQKVTIIWSSVLFVYFACLLSFQHTDVDLATIFNRSTQVLLFSISICIFMKESIKSNRIVFLNFVVCFGLYSLQLVLEFVGKAFLSDQKYSQFLFNQYNILGTILFLSIAVIYLVFDSIFRDFSTRVKYLSSIVVVVIFFGYYFYPFFYNPLHLYSTEDIKQWKTLDTYVNSTSRHDAQGTPTAIEIANDVKLQSWRDGNAVGDLYPEENVRRIEELIPYLEEGNWQVLFYRPLYLGIIQMNVVLIGFVILFYGYQYKKDPPQGAYIDKIMFLFLLYSSMEILHSWGFIKSLEWTSYNQMVTVGQYITAAIELLMVLFFSLRLRFITSVQGEFYETELATHPNQVTRWRDWVDDMILAQFFNFKIFNGRLFQDPSSK